MVLRQFMQIASVFVCLLALAGGPQVDFVDRPYAPGGLLAAETSPERNSADREAEESRGFRAAMAAHHPCSG